MAARWCYGFDPTTNSQNVHFLHQNETKIRICWGLGPKVNFISERTIHYLGSITSLKNPDYRPDINDTGKGEVPNHFDIVTKFS